MKNVKHRISTFALFVSLALFTVVSCKRDLDDLEPATYPTTPEVFIDGFSAGLNYGAFGGSKVTAFDVDTEVKYKGTSSMKFAVPDAGDPAGAYAGGAYFTASGRDLSGYDALTFWAKASKAATIDVVGFGNDFGESKYLTVLNGVAVNTNWQKFIIPIPDASKLTQERGMFFYSEGPEDGLGYTFWIDEVTFEKLGTLAHPKAAILLGQDQVIGAETGQQLPIGGLTATFNLPTGIDQTVSAAPSYFNFTSSDPSVASVSSTGVVTMVDAGTAVITATLGDLDAAGSLTVTSTGQAMGPQSPAPTPTIDADSVISMFSNAYNNVPIDTWNTGWQFSTAELLEVQVAGDDVKRYRNLNFVGIEFASQTINASAMTHFHLDIWTPDATALPAAFKVLLVDFGANGVFDGGDDTSHELSFTSPLLKTGEWVGIDIPLSNFTGLTNRAHLAQLVLSGDLPNVYVDNVYFYKSGGGTTTGPTTAAPTPTRNPADVISIFSDAYTNVAGTDFNPNWGQATVVSQVSVAGNNTLLYTGLNYQGTQFGSNLDASSMTHLHLDVWTSNSTLLNVFAISPGPVETPFALTVPTAGWASVDIPLSSFSPVALNDLIQFKFDGNGDIYLDNIYFYKTGGGGTTPTTAAPTPSFNSANVISVFSDAYTNVAGSDLNPNWGQATVVTQESIAGNNTLVYTGLNYQGLQLGSNQNLSAMTHLHLDFWTANSTVLKVFIISPGPVETPYTLTVPTSGWSSVDIPLTEFAPVDLTNVFQFKFEGDGKIYLDNILFHN
jgi:Bacterial Ig-like domain (group 2)